MKHEFVEYVPGNLEPDTLYISIPYDTAVHLCACGCGSEIVTPLSPADWSLMYDGRSVSLSPSIGNWSYPCRSHYYVWKGKIEWARAWSKYEIEAGRRKDMEDRQSIFRANPGSVEFKSLPSPAANASPRAPWYRRVARWVIGNSE